jgi:hypothetical protein
MSAQRVGLALVMTTIVLWAAGAAHGALPSSVPRDTWVPNGPPIAAEVIGDKAYIAGSFTHVGPYTGAFPRIDRTSGEARRGWPDVTGTVWASTPDGAGGWFIGGDFTHVGGLPRTNLARVTAEGTVDAAFAPVVTSEHGHRTVLALVRLGATLYVGGTLTSIGGQPRTALGAVDTTTGAPTAFAPAVTGGLPTTVETLNGRHSGGTTTLWVGGGFGSVAGQSRIGVASFTNGTLNTLAPAVDGVVEAIEPDGLTGLYLAGSFTTVNGVARVGIARVQGTEGKTTTPGFSANVAGDGGDGFGDHVYDLARTPAGLYLAGDFETVGGIARPNLALVDPATGAVDPWAPAVDPPAANRFLRDVAVDQATGTVFAGGPRVGVHAHDAATGERAGWAPLPAGADVATIEPAGADVLVGGLITVVGGAPRAGFAEIDLRSGRPTALDVSVGGGPIIDMTARGSKLFVAGSFSQTLGPGGTARKGVAVLDSAQGRWTAFAPDRIHRDAVFFTHVAVAGTTVWLSDGEQVRAFRDEADGAGLATRMPVEAKVGPGAGIDSLTATSDTVYVGGTFTKAAVLNLPAATVTEVARRNLAAFSIYGGVLPWDPDADGPVHALALEGATVFAGGAFTAAGGDAPRPGLAGLDATTGAATPLAWSEPGAVHAIAAIDGRLFTDRPFVPALDAIDPATGAPAGWTPQLAPANSTNRIRPAREFGVVVAGGLRVAAGPVRTAFFAVFPDPTVTLSGTEPPLESAPDAPSGTGPGLATGGPSGTGGPVANVIDRAPVLSKLTLTARRFRVSRRATALGAARVRVGTTIRFRLSERARVRLPVERARAGRRVGRSCRTPTRALRRKRRCTRYVRRGVIVRTGRAGANRVAFSGRLGKRALPPGAYRLVAQATDAAGKRSARRTVRFTVQR